MKRNKRRLQRGIGMVLAAVMLAASLQTAVPESFAYAASDKTLLALTVAYTGESVLVGEEIDTNKLTVMGLYSDGSYSRIKDYYLSSYTVTNEGKNTLTVYYDGISENFTVVGKRVSTLSAEYTGGVVTVGNSVVEKDINVTAYYSDGSYGSVENFTITSALITKVGTNEIEIVYGGKKATVYVTGKQVKAVEDIWAYYHGPDIVVGNAPKRTDITATAQYNDGTVEVITNYTLAPATVTKAGNNIIALSFGGKTTMIEITGVSKTVESITAEYRGIPVVVGQAVNPEDIEVTAVFNDGSKGTVTNFTLSSSIIYTIGENVITIFCGEATAIVLVRGVEAEIIDYDNGAKQTITEGKASTQITVAVPENFKAADVTITQVDKSAVKKAITRAVKTSTYMAFEISLLNGLETELPLTMKVTLPSGYEKDLFAVFYTPNRKTIAAQMNGEFLDNRTYEFKIFQPGTYVLVNAKESKEEPEVKKIPVETIKLPVETLTLKVGESYTLTTEVLPKNATNTELAFYSSRPKMVSVSKEGVIKGLQAGVSLITVSAADEGGASATVLVYVEE